MRFFCGNFVALNVFFKIKENILPASGVRNANIKFWVVNEPFFEVFLTIQLPNTGMAVYENQACFI